MIFVELVLTCMAMVRMSMEFVFEDKKDEVGQERTDTKRLKELSKKLGQRYFDKRLNQEEKLLLTHQFLLQAEQGNSGDITQGIISGDAWRNCHRLFEGKNVAIEDMPSLSRVVLKNEKNHKNDFFSAGLPFGLQKMLLSKQDEIPTKIMSEVMENVFEIMDVAHLDDAWDFLVMASKIKSENLDSTTKAKIELYREKVEDNLIKVFKDDPETEDYLRFFRDGKVVPKFVGLVFDRLQNEVADNDKVAYWTIRGIDDIHNYPKIETVLEKAIEDLGAAEMLLREIPLKDKPWKHEKYAPDLIEKSKIRLRKHLDGQLDAVDDFVTFKELFEETLNEADSRKVFEILDRMRMEDGGDVKAKILLEIIKNTNDDSERLNLESVVLANNMNMSELSEVFDGALSVKLLEVLLDNREKYADQIALMLSMLDASKLPLGLFNKIDSAIVDANLRVDPAYKGWYLCDTSEELLFKNLRSDVILINDSMLLKVDGKLAALCLKSFTLRESGRTFLAGTWYCPVDDKLRDDLMMRYRRGDLVADINEGSWMLMRSMTDLDEEVSAHELVKRAQRSAEKCRRKKTLRVGISKRKLQVENVEDMV